MNPSLFHSLLSLPQPCTPSDLPDALASFLCSVCHSPFCMKKSRCCFYQTVLKNLQRYKSLLGPFPMRHVRVKLSHGLHKCYEVLTKLFQTDDVERKWTYASLECWVLSAVPQIYFTFAGQRLCESYFRLMS